jgi:hypothetical protein
MRLILAGLAAVIAISTVEVPTASAQPGGTRNPFCLRDGPMGRGSWDCSYRSFRQCEASRIGAGGTCVANPWYEGPRAPQRQPRYY